MKILVKCLPPGKISAGAPDHDVFTPRALIKRTERLCQHKYQ